MEVAKSRVAWLTLVYRLGVLFFLAVIAYGQNPRPVEVTRMARFSVDGLPPVRIDSMPTVVLQSGARVEVTSMPAVNVNTLPKVEVDGPVPVYQSIGGR